MVNNMRFDYLISEEFLRLVCCLKWRKVKFFVNGFMIILKNQKEKMLILN